MSSVTHAEKTVAVTDFESYCREYVEINQMGTRGDYPGLRRLAGAIYDEWTQPGKNKELRSKILGEVMVIFSGRGEKDKPREFFEIARNYATQLLDRPGQLTEEGEIAILTAVAWDPSTVAEDSASHEKLARLAGDFARQDRARVVRYYFKALRRLEAAIDPKWDEQRNQYPMLPLPKGARYGIGGGLEWIDDPRLRAEALRVEAENSAATDRNIRQSALREIMSTYPQRMEDDIAWFYDRPPANLQELEAIFREFNVDQARRDRILQHIEKLCARTKAMYHGQPAIIP